MMHRRTVLAGTAGAAALSALPAAAQGNAPAGSRIDISFWYGLGGALGEEVERVIAAFNASQTQYRLVGTFRGSYPETMQAAIAAWRAGQAPHIVQMFEVGTGTMLGAGPAVKQTWQLFQETGVNIDPSQYLAGVRGYFSLPDGRLASMPFNSSTAMMWYNKDAFERAGLNPDEPPSTWQALVAACERLKERGGTQTVMTTTWPTWIQFEQYSAIHDIPFATRANGFEGLDAQLRINSAQHVKHVQRLLDMARNGLFRYAGRDSAADPLFPNGEAAISFNSSAGRARIEREARFRWGMALLPHDPEIIQRPGIGVIGGASLWTMTAPNRRPEEYRGVAAFYEFISRPDRDAEWHQRTGYVPITRGGWEASRAQGYFERNPGTELPIIQLTRSEPTENSRGFRLGGFVQIRTIIQEELELALQGQKTAQAAMDTAVERGNRVLRDFERAQRG